MCARVCVKERERWSSLGGNSEGLHISITVFGMKTFFPIKTVQWIQCPKTAWGSMSEPSLRGTPRVLLLYVTHLFEKWSLGMILSFQVSTQKQDLNSWWKDMQNRREAVLTVRNGDRSSSSNFGDCPSPATISSEHMQTVPSSCPPLPPIISSFPSSSLLLFAFLSSCHQTLMWQVERWSVWSELGEDCFSSFLSAC